MTSFRFAGNDNQPVVDAVFWEGPIPPDGALLTITQEINPTGANSRPYADMTVCFVAGTRIATPDGDIAVEDLRAGQRVITHDGVVQPIKWIGSRTIDRTELDHNDKLFPIVITKDALGHGVPAADLRISRQHRILVTSRIAQRMFKQPSVLVAAHVLAQLSGVYTDTDAPSVTYYHVLLDNHAVLLANGAPAESLYLGAQAAHALTAAQITEIRTILPQFLQDGTTMPPAFPLPTGRRQKQLVSRHMANNKDLITHTSL
jgi:hypothetical protein